MAFASVLALTGLISRRAGEATLILAAAAFMIQRLANHWRIRRARREGRAAIARLQSAGAVTATFGERCAVARRRRAHAAALLRRLRRGRRRRRPHLRMAARGRPDRRADARARRRRGSGAPHVPPLGPDRSNSGRRPQAMTRRYCAGAPPGADAGFDESLSSDAGPARFGLAGGVGGACSDAIRTAVSPSDAAPSRRGGCRRLGGRRLIGRTGAGRAGAGAWPPRCSQFLTFCAPPLNPPRTPPDGLAWRRRRPRPSTGRRQPARLARLPRPRPPAARRSRRGVWRRRRPRS